MAAAAADDDGERARTPLYLAMVRYMVATVVTVLAVVVIVMVITIAARRPEEIGLSVLQGHVAATSLWKAVVVNPYTPYTRGCIYRNRCGDDVVGPYTPRPTTTTRYVYEAQNNVSFGIYLRADNPGGRADINCTDITVNFLDMPNGTTSSSTGTVLGQLNLQQHGFVVRRKSSHTIRRWVTFNDKTVMSYIARTYGGWSSFSAMVEVAMVIRALGHSGPRKLRRNCGPVTVSVNEPSDDDQAVQCTGSDDGEEQ